MHFFLGFWSSNLYDINIPSQGYISTSQDIIGRIKKIQNGKALPAKAAKQRGEDKTMPLGLQEGLGQEFKKHMEDHLHDRNKAPRKARSYQTVLTKSRI